MLGHGNSPGTIRATSKPASTTHEPARTAPADFLKDEFNVSGTLGLHVEAAGAGNAMKVKAIILGGPADIEGTLEVGDVLETVNGSEVRRDNFMESIRGSDMLGTPNIISVKRKGEYVNASLTRTSAAHVGALTTAFSHIDKLSALISSPLQAGDSLEVVEQLRNHLRDTERSRLEYEKRLASRLKSQIAGEIEGPAHWRQRFEECTAALEQCKGEIQFLEEENRKLRMGRPDGRDKHQQANIPMELLDPDLNTWVYGSLQEREEGQKLLDELLSQAQVQVTEQEEILRMQDQQLMNQLSLALSRESEQKESEQQLFVERNELTQQRDNLQAKLNQLQEEISAVESQRDELAEQIGLRVTESESLRLDLERKDAEVIQFSSQRDDLALQLKQMTESAAEIQRKVIQEKLLSDEREREKEQVMQEKLSLEEEFAKLRQSSDIAGENLAYIHELSSQVSDLGNTCVALSQIVQTFKDRRMSVSDGSISSTESVTTALNAVDECLVSFVKKRTHCEVSRGLPPCLFEDLVSRQTEADQIEKITGEGEPEIRKESAPSGIGILLHQIHRPNGSWQYFIKELMPDGPAHRTELLREGDIVDFIDDQPLENVPFETVVDLVTGPEGSYVYLGLHRQIMQIEGGEEGNGIPEIMTFFVSIKRQCHVEAKHSGS